MALDASALAKFGENMRARQGGLSTKQVNWIVEGYNLGYLSAEEAKARFSQLIDEQAQA